MDKGSDSRSIYDLVVLGSGPAGQRAAIQGAKLKKRVLVIERHKLGGSSLHTGTIPSKTLREAALSPDCGTTDPVRTVIPRMRSVIQAEAVVMEQQLGRNSVEFVTGVGSLVDPHTIAIDGATGRRIVQAKYIVLATGTRPYRPKSVPFDNQVIFDSDSILDLHTTPRSLLVVGAGVIGCEYASIFARMGVKVTLVDRRQALLRSVDNEVVTALEHHFRGSGITVHLGTDAENIVAARDVEGHPVVYADVRGKRERFDALLYCMGRVGNVEELNLSVAGLVASDRGLLNVNEHFQTTQQHIYAVGDLIGSPALAASSAEQGRLASAHAFSRSASGFPKSFPFGIYTIPEISCVGLTEEELDKEARPYVVGRARYRELARGKILGDEHGFLKLLVDRESRKIRGIHILGSGATELIHIGQVAMALNADIDFFVGNVFNYPTLAEAYKVAAYNAYNQF